jgi:hypothetical protein
VESQLLLYTGKPTRKWSWLCVTHVQWYAITYILTELCRRTHGELVERAWKAIDAVLQFGSTATSDSSQKLSPEFGPHLRLGELDDDGYKPLNKLLGRARSAKGRGLSSDNSDARFQSTEAITSATDSSNDKHTAEREGLDLLSLGLAGFTPDGQALVSDSHPPYQAIDPCQELSDDHILQHPLYPQIDNETSHWEYWHTFP